MNRASFFKRLFVGVAAAPAIAQVIVEAEPKQLVRFEAGGDA